MPSVRDYQAPRRARALSVEDRQDMIIGAVIPLVLEFGKDVTSRQIAEAAGIAEGTIFRAFGDKETLLGAVVQRYLDPLALRTALRSIDPDLELDDKLREIFRLLHDRFQGVIRMMSMLGWREPPPRSGTNDFAEIIAEVLDPHRSQLRVDPEEIAQFARMLAFARAIPTFGESVPLSIEQIIDLFLHGVTLPGATTNAITKD